MIKLSVITSDQPNVIAKCIKRRADGTLEKTSTAYLTRGSVTNVEVADLWQFNGLLDSLAPCNALAFGAPSAPQSLLVKGADLPANPGAISRSDKYFTWPPGKGVMFLDYDPAPGEIAMQPQALTATLLDALGPCGMLWRPSASGFIYDVATGEEIEGLRGQHVYVTVKDAADIPRAGAVLFKRLWLMGYGQIALAKNGARLTRALVDGSVWQPSRLDFAAGAVCGPGIKRSPPAGVVLDGHVLDTRTALPELTDAEEQEYRRVLDAAKAASAPASANVREEYIVQRATAEGVPVGDVRARYDMAEQMQVLCGDFPIEMANGDVYSVAHILANAEIFHEKICLDPIEPEYNNRYPVGKIYIDSKGTSIDSKAHGGRVFTMGIDTGAAFKASANGGQTFKDTLKDVRLSGGELDEVDRLVRGINDGPFSASQRVLLRSELKGQLRENKRLDPQVAALIQGNDVPTTQAGVAQHSPDPQQPGQALPVGLPMHPRRWMAHHTKGKDEKPLATAENFAIMADAYGVQVAFNVISKNSVLRVPGVRDGGALQDEAELNAMISIANLNQFPKGEVPGFVCGMAHENAFNPVQELVLRRPWDGTDHVGLLFSQVVLEEGEDHVICEMFFRKWFRAAIAAGTGRVRGCENVLVWVESRGGVGKTRFFRTLCDAPLRADGVILDTTDKDSLKEVISHWLVELGELDGTLRRSDVAAMKAFLSKPDDTIRLPYARTSSKFSRTTAFMASVNSETFLVDDSGNRRFWPIRVKSLNHQHTVDVQQVWAQAWEEVKSGQVIHLTPDEERVVAERNKGFRQISPVIEMLESRVDVYAERTIHMTCTQVATQCGMSGPRKDQLNEISAWLRDNGFEKRKRGGCTGYMMPPLVIIAGGGGDITSQAFQVVK